MKKYYVSETHDLHEYKTPEVVYAKNLTEVKLKASYNHKFNFTALKIYSDPIINLISYKKDGIWTNI